MADGSDWYRLFDKPIQLPGGGELRTLLDAGRYIAALPRATQERREWRIATEMLLMVAEGRWPIAFAEIAIRRALNDGEPPPFFVCESSCDIVLIRPLSGSGSSAQLWL